MSLRSSTVGDFNSTVSRQHINHIKLTHMPDCHLHTDSSAFHAVNPGEEKMERQRVRERGHAEREEKDDGGTKEAKIRRIARNKLGGENQKK